MPSFLYEEMAEGLLDDIRVRMTNVRFLLHEFTPGDGAKPCFAYTPVDVENEDNALRDELFTCGAADNWVPSDDGKNMIYIGPGDGEGKEMSKSSGFGFWLKNVGAAGFPKSLVKKDDISFFEGVEVHLMRLPTGNKRQDGSESTKAVPVKFFLKTAGEQKATKGKATGKGKAKATTDAGSSPNGTEEGIAESLGLLIKVAVATAADGIPRAQLSTLIKGQTAQDTAWKRAAMKMTIAEDTFKTFLTSLDLALVDGVIDVKVEA